MVAISQTDTSPVELQASYVAMVVADKVGVVDSSSPETQFLSSKLSQRGITKTSPKLVEISEAETALKAFKNLGAASDALIEKIVSNPENSAQIAQDVEALLQQTETLFATGLSEGSAALKNLHEAILSMRAILQQARLQGEVEATAPAPALESPESTAPQGTDEPQNSKGPSTSSLNDARVEMMMAILNAQADTMNATFTKMKGQEIASSQAVNVINTNLILANANADQQCANEEAQQKKHFWRMFGCITASCVAAIAGAVLTVVTVGAAAGVEAGIIAGSIALCSSAALMTMQYTGTMDAMFAGINNPGLRFLAETAFTLSVAALSAGVAAGATLATAATEIGAEAAAAGLSEAVEMAGSELASSEAAPLIMEGVEEEALQNLGDDALKSGQKAAMKIAKTMAFVTGTQAFMSTSAIADFAQFQVDLVCKMGGWDKDSKDAKIAAMTLQIVYTAIFMGCSMAVGSSMMSSSLGELGGASKLGMSTASTAAMMYMQQGMNAASLLFNAFGEAMGISLGRTKLRMAELQEEAGAIQASMQNAESQSELANQNIKAIEKFSSQEQNTFQELISDWSNFFNDWKAAADALQG